MVINDQDQDPEQEHLDSIEEPRKKKRKKLFSRRRVRRWIARIVVGLLALIFILVSLFWIPANLTYQVKETFTLSAEDSTNIQLVVMLPTSGGYQTVTDPEVEWPGTWQSEMVGRMVLVRLEGEIPAGETLTAEIAYDVELFQGKTSWVGEPVTEYDLTTEHIGQEYYDQVMSLYVENNPLATMRQLYDYVGSDKLIPGSGQKAGALANDSRIVEIPAREVIGWIFNDSLPLFTKQISNEPSLGLKYWDEIFIQDAWEIVDPSMWGGFLKPRSLGWTDGRHLVLDDLSDLQAVAQSLEDEAGRGSWGYSELSSLAYSVWSLDGEDSFEITSVMTAQKTWDGRWAMAIAVVVMLVVLERMMENDHLTKKSKRKPVGYEI